REGDTLEGGGLLSGLLQPLEGLGARIQFVRRSGRNEAPGLHVVDLDALLALGWKAKVGFGLQPLRLGEGAEKDLAVADGERSLVGRAVARGAAAGRGAG